MLESWALNQTRCYNPITKHTLITAMNYLAKNDNPPRNVKNSNHRTWINGFMSRNTVVNLRTPQK